MSAIHIDRDLVQKVSETLCEIYIVPAYTGPAIGLWYERVSGAYFVDGFLDGVPIHKPFLEFENRAIFTAWLEQQSDKSLASI